MQKKATFIFLVFLLICSVAIPTVAAFAYGIIVNATVQPTYSLQREGNTLFLNTNMTVWLNGKRIFH